MTRPLPDPIVALRKSEALRATLELDWLEIGEREFVRDNWLEVWNQVPFDEPFHGDNRHRLERCVPLAQGLSRERRLSHTRSQLALAWDPEDPDVVFVSLSHALPPLLWLRLSPTPHAIADGLAPYLAEPGPIARLSHRVRVVKPLGIDDRAVIENAIGSLELWMDDTCWASAFDDDPWLGAEFPMGMLDQAAWWRDVLQEHETRFPSLSYRTLWSRSVLRIEQHPMGMWVFDVAYDPAHSGREVSFVNEITHSRLPADLPIDVAASLLRGPNLDHQYIAELAARGELPTDQLAIGCALEPGEPTAFAMLRAAAHAHRDDSQMLRVVADLAISYRHEQLLFELGDLAAGTDLYADLLPYLMPRPWP